MSAGHDLVSSGYACYPESSFLYGDGEGQKMTIGLQIHR